MVDLERAGAFDFHEQGTSVAAAVFAAEYRDSLHARESLSARFILVRSALVFHMVDGESGQVKENVREIYGIVEIAASSYTNVAVLIADRQELPRKRPKKASSTSGTFLAVHVEQEK